MRLKILLVLLSFVGVLTSGAQNNTLTIPSVSTSPGQTIDLPVNLDNTTDVVAVQFKLSVPEGITLQPASALLTERAEGLSVIMREVGKGNYMAMIFSTVNKVILGRTGTIMTVPLKISSSLEEGKSYKMQLSNVVIGVKDGSNVSTGFEAGSVTIAKSVDLEVSSVSVDVSSANPGEQILINWQVANIGGVSTGDGWSEQIYIISSDGYEKLISTVYHEDILNAGGVIGRSTRTIIPEIIGIDGDSRIKVRLVPNSASGEPSWLLANNSALSETIINIGKKLKLSPVSQSVEEKGNGTIRLTLTRSGCTHDDEIFNIKSIGDERITTPLCVTIPAGHSGVNFYPSITANKRIDENSVVEIKVSGEGYETVSSIFNIEDDVLPVLEILCDEDEVMEGEDIRFVIKAQNAPVEDTRIIISCEFADLFIVPDVILPAGHTVTEAIIHAKDDDIPNIDNVVEFAVSANGYSSGVYYVLIKDNDIPTIDLTLTPNAVSESAGLNSIIAKIYRTDNINKRVTIKLSDDSNGNIFYDRKTIEMAPGVQEVTLPIGPIDNSTVDGERTINVSAAVWIASCSCNAGNGESGGAVTVPVTIYDNDGPSLSLTTSSSAIKEGEELELTVTRNTKASTALDVSIISDHEEDLVYPSTITIPSGEISASFKIKSNRRDSNNDSFTASVTVSSEGYSKANAWFIVTDQTLPDGQISTIEISETEIVVGGEITVKASIKNTGSYDLPELTKIGFYHSSQRAPLATAYLQSPLPAGQIIEISKVVKLPDAVGEYDLYAIVNDGKQIKELVYTNNTSPLVSVKTLTPFTFSLDTDKKVYHKDEPIVISGKAEGLNNSFREIEVYLLNSYRQVLSTITDEEGKFSVSWIPTSQQCGHYIVGACYPGEKTDTEYVSFDIYGMTLKTELKGIESSVDEKYTGTIILTNPGVLPLNNVVCTVSSVSDSYEVSIENDGIVGAIPANSNAIVSYTILGKKPTAGNDYERIKIVATANDNVEANGVIYYYCNPQFGKIVSNISTIDCTVSKGSYRDIPVEITNVGKGETGDISLSIASSWIKNVTPLKIGSLKHGDSTTIVLRLNAEGLQLNVPQTAKIGINCEQGEGMMLNVMMEPVSMEIGRLVVDVRDQYTYNTSEAPHLSGAEVKITHPIDNRIIASGITNEYGIFEVDLPEGYYGISVRAEKHESYSNNILINPGRTNTKNVDLSYTGGITISYTVEPVEGGIEDSYRIVTHVTYETNVPVPVVVLEGPTSVDTESMFPGESVILNFTATNKGLVTALDYHLVLPDPNEEYSMTPLYDPTPRDLPANTSAPYPILFTWNPSYSMQDNAPSRSKGTRSFTTCMEGIEQWYRDMCGSELRDNHGAVKIALKACGAAAIAEILMDQIASIPSIWHPSRGNGWGGSSFRGTGGNNMVGIDSDHTICNPDVADALNDGLNLVLGAGLGAIGAGLPGALGALGTALGMLNTAMDLSIETAVDGHPSMETVGGIVLGAVTPFLSEGVQMLTETASNLAQAAAYLANHRGVLRSKAGEDTENRKRILPDWMVYFGGVAQKLCEQLDAEIAIQTEIFGDHHWIDHYDETMLPFVEELIKLKPDEVSIDSLISHKPESISSEMFETFVNRCYNIVNGVDAENVPDYNRIIEYGNILRQIEEYAKEKGYKSMPEMYRVELEKYRKLLNEESNSVCSSISLHFEQRLVMTREAFRGTLTVYNGHDSDAMEDIVLNLTVKDVNGKHATSHEMTITTESISNFGNSSLGSNWTLAANETGKATILYIPTKYAAPETPLDYIFGGSLSYINPYNGLRVTENFTPITITVSPSPNLDLVYFLQRDVIGDDPLTEIVEPSEEAEFSLLINNIGYGDAVNVRMFTEQPTIVENEKGLKIDFDIVSSQLNGGDKSLAMGGSVTTDYGDIPAKTSKYAQWWIKSSILGHFTEYNVEATHITSYNNPDLTLLNDVTIHELIRSIDVDSGVEGLCGFMTNDIPDPYDAPDMLYLSNGNVESVSVTYSSNIRRLSETNYELIISPAAIGWNYGDLYDPTYGVVKLQKVVRQRDGKEISLRNFWLTDRTLRDSKDPLYENRIHFIDNFSGLKPETYILTFEPKPDLLLEVVSIEGLPDEGSVSLSQVDSIYVTFNKPIDPSTFTEDDMVFYVQGERQHLGQIGVSSKDNKTFLLDMTELNKNVGNGYHVLTIQTSGITDTEGFSGKNGKSVGWNVYVDGLISINTSIYPDSAGIIKCGRNKFYGETTTFTAEANEGYVFSHWIVDGIEVSKDPEWRTVVINDMEVVANFLTKKYNVTVDGTLPNGEICGTKTGIYPYGENLVFSAVANDDFEFEHWILNGEILDSCTPTLDVVIKQDTNISASFRYVGQYYQLLSFEKGWNWISSYLDLSDFNVNALMTDENLVRILSQTKEIIRDPELGPIGSIAEMSPMECYKAEVIDKTDIKISSYGLWNSSMSIMVHSGWNWIGYPLCKTLSIDDAFSGSNVDILDVIVGQEGFAQYNGDKWIGTLEEMTPGLGYMYQSMSDKFISYVIVPYASPIASEENLKRIKNHLDINIHKYMSVMSLILNVVSTEGALLDNKDYQVSAFCGTECRGIGRVVNGLVMMNVYGNVNDDITFMVTDAEGERGYANDASLIFSETVVGDIFDPYPIAINDQSGITKVNYDGNIKVAVEGDMLRIKGINPDEIELVEVYDLNGLKLIRETRVPESGIRISTLTEGVYVVIVNGNGEYTYHKIAVR